jgi:hypothetical protein
VGPGPLRPADRGRFEDPASESVRAGELAERELGRDGADVVVLYRSEDLTVDDPAYREAVTASLAALPAGRSSGRRRGSTPAPRSW